MYSLLTFISYTILWGHRGLEHNSSSQWDTVSSDKSPKVKQRHRQICMQTHFQLRAILSENCFKLQSLNFTLQIKAWITQNNTYFHVILAFITYALYIIAEEFCAKILCHLERTKCETALTLASHLSVGFTVYWSWMLALECHTVSWFIIIIIKIKV